MKRILFITPALTPLYLIKVSLFGLPTNVFELLTVAALLLAFSKWKHLAFRKFYNENKLFCYGIVLIIFGLVFSLLYNKTCAVSLGILKSWFLLPIIFSFILYFALKTREDVLFVLKSIYVSIFVVALISLGYKILGIVTFDGRLEAFYNSPNYLAMFLAPGVFLGWYFISSTVCHSGLDPESRAMPKRWIPVFTGMTPRAPYVFSLSLIVLALYFTYSYAAWIAILGTFGLLGFLRRYFLGADLSPSPGSVKAQLRRRYLAALFAICLLLFATQLGNQKFVDLINQNPRSSFASRMMIWQSSAKMIADSPFFGIGAGNFQKTYLAYQKYFPLYLEWAVPQPHNLFLAFWLEAGLTGLAGFVAVACYLLYVLAKAIRKKQDANLAFLFVAVFSYVLLHGLIDTTYWKNDLSFLFWIFAFLAIFVSRRQ